MVSAAGSLRCAASVLGRDAALAVALPVAWAVALTVALAGCSAPSPMTQLQQEQFGSTTTHSRDYGAPGGATCEAARRALLSQGYVISLADSEHVNGKKNFQPEPSMHLEIEFHVVCATADRPGHKSIAFVNALQDRYALKKSNNSASLGVGALGSVSLPFSSSDDSMVRVGSETITAQSFYDRFFALVDRYLMADTIEDVPPELPAPAPAASAASAASSNRAASAP